VTHHATVRELLLGNLGDQDIKTLAEIWEKAMPGTVSSLGQRQPHDSRAAMSARAGQCRSRPTLRRGLAIRQMRASWSWQHSEADPDIGQLPYVPRAWSSTYSRQPRRRSETPET
jgi:hypothetical protein